MTGARFICTKCQHFMEPGDDISAASRTCGECGAWAVRTTSPAGRWVAHKASIDLPETYLHCHQLLEMQEGGPAPICPNLADGNDGLCKRCRAARKPAQPVNDAAPTPDPEAEETAASSDVVVYHCDWCSDLAPPGKPLRRVPGEYVSPRPGSRELMVCGECARKVSRRTKPNDKPVETLNLFEQMAGVA